MPISQNILNPLHPTSSKSSDSSSNMSAKKGERSEQVKKSKLQKGKGKKRDEGTANNLDVDPSSQAKDAIATPLQPLTLSVDEQGRLMMEGPPSPTQIAKPERRRTLSLGPLSALRDTLKSKTTKGKFGEEMTTTQEPVKDEHEQSSIRAKRRVSMPVHSADEPGATPRVRRTSMLLGGRRQNFENLATEFGESAPAAFPRSESPEPRELPPVETASPSHIRFDQSADKRSDSPVSASKIDRKASVVKRMRTISTGATHKLSDFMAGLQKDKVAPISPTVPIATESEPVSPRSSSPTSSLRFSTGDATPPPQSPVNESAFDRKKSLAKRMRKISTGTSNKITGLVANLKTTNLKNPSDAFEIVSEPSSPTVNASVHVETLENSSPAASVRSSIRFDDTVVPQPDKSADKFDRKKSISQRMRTISTGTGARLKDLRSSIIVGEKRKSMELARHQRSVSEGTSRSRPQSKLFSSFIAPTETEPPLETRGPQLETNSVVSASETTSGIAKEGVSMHVPSDNDLASVLVAFPAPAVLESTLVIEELTQGSLGASGVDKPLPSVPAGEKDLETASVDDAYVMAVAPISEPANLDLVKPDISDVQGQEFVVATAPTATAEYTTTAAEKTDTTPATELSVSTREPIEEITTAAPAISEPTELIISASATEAVKESIEETGGLTDAIAPAGATIQGIEEHCEKANLDIAAIVAAPELNVADPATEPIKLSKEIIDTPVASQDIRETNEQPGSTKEDHNREVSTSTIATVDSGIGMEDKATGPTSSKLVEVAEDPVPAEANAQEAPTEPVAPVATPEDNSKAVNAPDNTQLVQTVDGQVAAAQEIPLSFIAYAFSICWGSPSTAVRQHS